MGSSLFFIVTYFSLRQSVQVVTLLLIESSFPETDSVQFISLSVYYLHLEQWALLSLISEDNQCTRVLVCPFPIILPIQSISGCRSDIVVVSSSQKIKL